MIIARNAGGIAGTNAYLIGDGTPPAIAGDVTRLRQVLLNLVANAVRYSPHGSTVRVDVNADAARAVGLGLAAAALATMRVYRERDVVGDAPPDQRGPGSVEARAHLERTLAVYREILGT